MSFTNEFFAWADSHRLKPRHLEGFFNKSTKTISGWRTKGIPKSMKPLCVEYRKNIEAKINEGSQLYGYKVTLEVDRVTFNDWNKKALAKGQLIEDWAIHKLNN